MRFLHAADIHLDSPLRGLDQYEGAPVDVLRGATRKAFQALVQLAIAERVDFVILAGDLYDGDWPDYNSGLFFVSGMRELEKAKIPVLLIRGNHDAESRTTHYLTLPDNVHSFATSEPSTKKLDELRVALHGQGFAKQAETRNLAANYPAPVSGYFNIGILHTALDGREGHANYAPCTVGELIARDYDYWALGHIHQRESVNGTQRPRIEFPGNVQGRHARETGAKGCLLVTVDGARVTTEFRPLDVVRWQVLVVDGADAESAADLLAIVRAAVSAAQDEAEGRPLAVRLVLTCPDALRHRVAADADQFRAELAAQFGKDVWIEKIKWKQLPSTAASSPILSEDAASELRTVLAEIQADPEAAWEDFAAGECEKLLKSLPANLRNVAKESWNDIVARAAVLLQASAEDQS
ncbi:exonuclease SbcCD subunit D [Anatilimnocola sp. NA78]|uniref:metallophosphoesterase family protein n=1 Tax=Anatilimnocola sp. NA78 TaxID=3415683 RepID=UPI003CE55F88